MVILNCNVPTHKIGYFYIFLYNWFWGRERSLGHYRSMLYYPASIVSLLRTLRVHLVTSCDHPSPPATGRSVGRHPLVPSSASLTTRCTEVPLSEKVVWGSEAMRGCCDDELDWRLPKLREVAGGEGWSQLITKHAGRVRRSLTMLAGGCSVDI